MNDPADEPGGQMSGGRVDRFEVVDVACQGVFVVGDDFERRAVTDQPASPMSQVGQAFARQVEIL